MLFKIPKPKYNLRAPNKTYGSFFSKTIKDIENILLKEKDAVRATLEGILGTQ